MKVQECCRTAVERARLWLTQPADRAQLVKQRAESAESDGTCVLHATSRLT